MTPAPYRLYHCNAAYNMSVHRQQLCNAADLLPAPVNSGATVKLVQARCFNYLLSLLDPSDKQTGPVMQQLPCSQSYRIHFRLSLAT